MLQVCNFVKGFKQPNKSVQKLLVLIRTKSKGTHFEMFKTTGHCCDIFIVFYIILSHNRLELLKKMILHHGLFKTQDQETMEI